MFPAHVIIDYDFPHTGKMQRKRLTDTNGINERDIDSLGLGVTQCQCTQLKNLLFHHYSKSSTAWLNKQRAVSIFSLNIFTYLGENIWALTWENIWKQGTNGAALYEKTNHTNRVLKNNDNNFVLHSVCRVHQNACFGRKKRALGSLSFTASNHHFPRRWVACPILWVYKFLCHSKLQNTLFVILLEFIQWLVK